jgi:hypothetical protein
MTQTNQDKIDNILAKNTDENGLYPALMRRLKPEDCKIGDIVRDVCGQFSEIKGVKHNANEYGDTKIILNNLRIGVGSIIHICILICKQFIN